MNDKCHVIWSSEINVEDWKDDILEMYPDDDLTDEEIYDLALRENDESLECERENLHIDLHREIIVLGDLGLWHGRVRGYKELRGTCVSDCLNEAVGDYVTWYVDELGDLRCDDTHHDGTNHYLYRVFKPGMSYWQKDNFKYKVYCGTATRRDINRYTERLGDVIANVYGFKIRKKSYKGAIAC